MILYSGGTTGVTKGILLSNLNFNALGAQIIATNPMFAPGDKMLTIMPMFHGFGLGVSVHSMMVNGGRCVLVPRFTPQTYAKLLAKHHPNFIAGVPTLYEALLRIPGLEKLDLSCLKGVFSGGDTLSVELKKRIDAFLKEHKRHHRGARGLRHHRMRDGQLPDAQRTGARGLHRHSLPGYLLQDRDAGHGGSRCPTARRARSAWPGRR